VLAVLAMLAAIGRLRVAPRGCALPLTAAPRGTVRWCRPGRRNGVLAEQRNGVKNLSLSALALIFLDRSGFCSKRKVEEGEALFRLTRRQQLRPRCIHLLIEGRAARLHDGSERNVAAA